MATTGGQITYATIAATNIPARSHATAIARGEDAEKQIVICSKDKKTKEAAASLKTEAELIAKAEMTIKLMMEEGETPQVHVKFVAGYRAKTGAIIYTLNSKEAASWLKYPSRLQLFNNKFGDSTETHAKLFNVMAYYVPTTFEPGSEARKRQIELDNDLRKNGLTHAKYIKPIHKRAHNQRTAHVILGFATRADANEVIAKRWIVIDEKKVSVKKLVAEPRRCYKCQSTKGDHTADTCTEKEPKCARCAGIHLTEKCDKPSETKCVNCNSTDHGAGNRDCPAFQQSVREHRNRNLEGNYRFYPILGDLLSLELLDGSYAQDYTRNGTSNNNRTANQDNGEGEPGHQVSGRLGLVRNWSEDDPSDPNSRWTTYPDYN
jgi:hypothetical protein